MLFLLHSVLCENRLLQCNPVLNRILSFRNAICNDQQFTFFLGKAFCRRFSENVLSDFLLRVLFQGALCFLAASLLRISCWAEPQVQIRSFRKIKNHSHSRYQGVCVCPETTLLKFCFQTELVVANIVVIVCSVRIKKINLLPNFEGKHEDSEGSKEKKRHPTQVHICLGQFAKNYTPFKHPLFAAAQVQARIFFSRFGSLIGNVFFRRVESTPDPDTLKSIAIHLSFLSRDFCKSNTPPICITIHLPFVSRCFCRSIGVRGRWDTPDLWSGLPFQRASSGGWDGGRKGRFWGTPIFGQNPGKESIFPQQDAKIGAPQRQAFLPPPIPSPTRRPLTIGVLYFLGVSSSTAQRSATRKSVAATPHRAQRAISV